MRLLFQLLFILRREQFYSAFQLSCNNSENVSQNIFSFHIQIQLKSSSNLIPKYILFKKRFKSFVKSSESIISVDYDLIQEIIILIYLFAQLRQRVAPGRLK